MDKLLIATKLHIPPAHAECISRPQLFTLLEQGLQVPFTLISAPAGFGKSTLLASWLQTRRPDLKTAWLSLDESDSEPDFFWRYFIASLQTCLPELGHTAQTMLAAPSAPDMPTILTSLINELAALNTPLLWVLDDYHRIQNPQIHENLKFLLDHLPASIHLVLLTREDPPFGLARRRARRQLVEIRAADLRFNLNETRDFLLDMCKLHLTPAQIDLLEQRTEGWVTGLQMAALSLQGRDPAQFFASFTGDDRYIADYLIEEVLQRQPETLREFLLKTSILERLSAPLCAALTGDPAAAREQLDTLERTNLFLVPLDNRREWYRYHHLFAALLRQRLPASHSPDEIAALQRSASAWYESQGMIAEAITHARLIPDEKRVWRLLLTYAGLFFEQGRLPQLVEFANALPVEFRQESPALSATVAWAALATSTFKTAQDWLKAIEAHFGLSAEAAIQDPALDPLQRAALLEVLVIRLHLPDTPPTPQHVLAIRDQLNNLPPEQICLFTSIASLKPVISFNLGLFGENMGQTAQAAADFDEAIHQSRQQANWHLFHLARAHFASLQTAMGQLHAARQTYEQALAEDPTLNASPNTSLLYAGLGALYYEWNDLAAAEKYYKEGLELARLWNQWESLVPISLGLARLKQRAGRTAEALALLEKLGKPPYEAMHLPLDTYKTLLRALTGSQASAAAWLEAQASVQFEPGPNNETVLLDLADLLLALQRPEQAGELLQKLYRYAQHTGRIYSQVRAAAALARVQAIQGQTSQAVNNLLVVLPLARPEGYLSTFIDEGESMRRLLLETRGKIQAPELRQYLDQILAAFGTGENTPKPEISTGLPDLSEREREILSLVAAGLSNQEIANRLIISITTVKTHVSNIFNKLGVTSRIQAVACAETLGLLPKH
jgi:LuxR family maltose regulon positive regulatory protein